MNPNSSPPESEPNLTPESSSPIPRRVGPQLGLSAFAAILVLGLVLGVVGRFWTTDGGVERLGPAGFASFDAPGFAKGAMNFHARAADGGTLLTTETRIQATDDSARRSFGRYWRVIGPFSALIRRAWLRAIRKRAERR